jgi:glycine cleavage system H protein
MILEKVPNYLKYTETHEWVRDEGDGTAVVGITEHAQHALGEIVYIELPDVDVEVVAQDEVAVVESVKAAADIYAPISGKIIEINEDLEDAPGLVNSDPYGDGWLFKIEISDTTELEGLIGAADYGQILAEDDE